MSLADRKKRIEQKYIVLEDTAIDLREYVRTHLKLDEHGEEKKNFSYEVQDLYLDSEDLRLYWSCIESCENQLRIRFRYYGADREAPVFLETKQRVKDHIIKERAAIRRDSAARLSCESDPDPHFLVSRTRNQVLTLNRFAQIVRNLNTKPKLQVAFSREAYRMPGASINFDRSLRAEPASSTALTSEMHHPTLIFGNDVVLEFKFINDEPELLKQIVHRFDLRSAEVDKYVDAVALLGENRFRS